MYKQKDLQNDTEKITNMFVDCRSSYKIPKHILKYQRIGKKELWKPSEVMEGFCCVISLTLVTADDGDLQRVSVNVVIT